MKIEITGVIYQPFIVFSMYSNGKKLFACQNAGKLSDTIQCIDGIRAISVIWIVYCHTHQEAIKIPFRETKSSNEVIHTHSTLNTSALLE